MEVNADCIKATSELSSSGSAQSQRHERKKQTGMGVRYGKINLSLGLL